MNLSANAQATLLLTSDFSRAAASERKPLSNSEWVTVALWRASGAATARETYRLERSAYFSGAYSWLAGARS